MIVKMKMTGELKSKICCPQVAITLIQHHGKAFVGPLVTKLEEFLVSAPKTADFDVVRQSAIVIMGNLARHLDAKHPKIRPVVHQLLAALSTPSEEVQKAVSSCIAPLVVSIDEDIKSVVPNLLHVLYESDSYAHRRGAAYGLAGVFQGLGIMSLKDYDIMVTIMGGLQDKKNVQRRESRWNYPTEYFTLPENFVNFFLKKKLGRFFF